MFRMLEIGALSPCNYAATQSWIDNSPIDLNSQHPAIQQQDFLQKPVPSAPEEQYDIVSCSLVLNFVPDITDRGKYTLHRTNV
jgi:25S rRNA (adenine2142-N1)-methyltransferase